MPSGMLRASSRMVRMISAPVMSAAKCMRLREVPPPWMVFSVPSSYLEKLTPRSLQPLDRVRGVAHQGLHQFGDVGEVAAAHDVEVVVVGRVLVALGGRLDAALGHHGVGIAVAQLGRHDAPWRPARGQDRRRGSGAAATDDEHVGLVPGSARFTCLGIHPAGGLDEIGDLVGDGVALGWSNLERAPALLLEVGVELQAFLALSRSEERDLIAGLLARNAFLAGGFDLLDQFLEFRVCRAWLTSHARPTLDAGFQSSSPMWGSISRST
jgi:hypothetical protein